MKHLLSLLFAALLLVSAPAPSNAQSLQSEWLTASQFQSYLQTNISGTGMVPIRLEADIFGGQAYYFADFRRITGVGWAVQLGLSDSTFLQRDAEYRSQGYRLYNQQRITTGGRVRNQGIWHR